MKTTVESKKDIENFIKKYCKFSAKDKQIDPDKFMNALFNGESESLKNSATYKQFIKFLEREGAEIINGNGTNE